MSDAEETKTQRKPRTRLPARDKEFISVLECTLSTGLSPQTVRKMADDQTLTSYRTPNGQRRISRASVQALCRAVPCSDKVQATVKRTNFLYARVSTKKQMDDLSRQVSFLQSQRPEYSGPEYTVVRDVGSGINFKRVGLQTILDACLQGTIGQVVVAHRDRLCRFGYELVEQLVTKAGGQIVVIDNERGTKSSEQELADDLLAIVHIFTCRQMGKRKYVPRTPRVQSACDSSVPDAETSEKTT